MYVNKNWITLLLTVSTLLFGALNANAQTIPTRTPTPGGSPRATNTPRPTRSNSFVTTTPRSATNTPRPTQIPDELFDAFIVIFDSSWSMTSPVKGSEHLLPDDPDSRVMIAKNGLMTILYNTLPQETSFGLRAFGNREGNFACRTDMEYPLQPMDRTDAVVKVSRLEPQYNARTAITAALTKLPDDLSDFDGNVKVVLMTDGQDTCGGDPLAAITDLRTTRPDTAVDVIAFEVENSRLQGELETWAEVGGGVYHGVDDVDSVTMAFATTFGMGEPTAVAVVQNDVVVPAVIMLFATIPLLTITAYYFVKSKDLSVM